MGKRGVEECHSDKTEKKPHTKKGIALTSKQKNKTKQTTATELLLFVHLFPIC